VTEDVSRRRLLEGAAVGGIGALAGCAFLPDSGRSGSGQPATYSGRIVDIEENPVASASVEALVGGSESRAEVTTDGSGAFDLRADRAPVWLRVTHPDFVTEVRAVDPGTDIRVPLTPAEGVVSMAFGGDVMFGRRFYGTNDDPSEPQARIYPGSRRADHDAILRYVAPLFRGADVSSVNLETPLTESTWRHPTKDFTFTSHPVAAAALAGAGVDYASLGNNHTFDALKPGLRDTLSAVDEAGIAHSGAGRSPSEAWAPADLTRDGVRVAFVSCTTIAGRQYEIDWSADTTDGGPHTVSRRGKSITFRDGIGAAEATEARLERAVTEADREADVVVVQIHGDDEYRRTPTERLVALTDAASAAGADLVVNHHPHVTGGIERRNGALVAWTLGNLVFDQELWSTLRSYALVVHASADGIVRAYTQPLVLDGYVPKATTGRLARRLSWETAGLSAADATLVSFGHRIELGAYADSVSASRRRTQEVAADGAIYERTGGWVDDATGAVRLGRDRLFAGGFDDATVDDDRAVAPLFRYGTGPSARRRQSRDGALRLIAHPENSRRSLLSPGSRLSIDGDRYDLTCRYRYDGSGGLSALVSWYNAAEGISIDHETRELAGTDGEWRRFTEAFAPPPEATWINVFVFLTPPVGDEPRRVDIDDLRLVEWAPPDRTGGREFDHALVRGSATLELRGNAVAPSEWTRLTDATDG
jgi:poly-gamma-glutamate capsule biosynthesis protein CapA/YwtB (metallophosphatase superfamily)